MFRALRAHSPWASRHTLSLCTCRCKGVMTQSRPSSRQVMISLLIVDFSSRRPRQRLPAL
eukprot:6932261-Karenia_brevis.AAC.1